ncbi:CPBP family intramembrane glutamic endopeptidase [Clostridium botulinum]|uniref:CPBP family intramembrane glutamic endopeptidase n=1 Tax=Clostridium botulinum TaxID=1491 RepID=UPI0024911463|nr:type II CAAX endopeptidase family protein [Clostridium botulinum]BDB00514.1 CAAX amino protease [Clostridium botulinum]
MFEHSVSKKELILFLVVTFGFTAIMGIAMAFTYPKYKVDAFPLVQMCYPATGVMIALLLNKNKRKELPIKFYGVYLFFTITLVLYILVEIFIFHKNPGWYVEYYTIIGSLALIIMYFSDEKDKIDAFGLKVGKNSKECIRYTLLFVILYLCANFLGQLIFGNVKDFIASFKDPKRLVGMFLLPFSFPLAFIVFLGEEYGWRYFLQTALQERLGKRKGIILLGVIWGIWHLPLNLFYYSPKTSFYSVINQLIICIGYSVFFGFVYMKTKNIWAVSMIHFINNNLGFILYGSTGADVVFSGKAVLGNLFCIFVIYLPFLFAKEYSKKEAEVSNYSG